MTAPLYLEPGRVPDPERALSCGGMERKCIQQTEEEESTGTLAGTGHTEGPVWPAAEGAGRRW